MTRNEHIAHRFASIGAGSLSEMLAEFGADSILLCHHPALETDGLRVRDELVEEIAAETASGDRSFRNQTRNWAALPTANGVEGSLRIVGTMIDGTEIDMTVQMAFTLDIDGRISRYDVTFGDPAAVDTILATGTDHRT